MCEQTYTLGGTAIRVLCDEAEQAVQLARCWQLLFSLCRVDAPASMPVIHLHFRAADQPMARPALLTHFCQSGPLQGWQTARGYYLQCANASLALNLRQSCGVGRLTPSFWACSLAEQREFFLVSLLMLLRSHGYYGLHANGVVNGEGGVLLIGDSGAGKTTLTLSLVQAGWRYLADDALLLRRDNEHVAALALRRGFACREQTLHYFPHLPAAHSPDLMDGKKLLTVEAIGNSAVRLCCTPHVLLFPQIGGGPHSRLAPLDEASALTTLIRLSTGILTERASVVQQIEVLKALVQQARCYQLRLGADVYEAPAAVAALLAAA